MKKFLNVLMITVLFVMMFSVCFAANASITRPSTGSLPSRIPTTKTISEIKITVKEPKYGEKFDWAPVMVTEGITFDHMYWSGLNLTTAGQYAGVSEDETAIATKYYATIFFKVNEGYKLDSSLKTATVNDTSNLEILSLNFSPHGVKTPTFEVQKPEASTEEIEGFNLDISEIKVGSALPNTCEFSTNSKKETIAIPTKETLTKAYWMPEETIAKADTEYVLHFERNLEGAKVSDQYRVLVNNVEITGYRISNGILEFNYRVKTPAETSTETPKENTFKVEFNTNGGNKIDTIEVKEGAQVTKPADPTKEGYTFGGWYTDAELKTAFDFATKISTNYTLYAKWTEVKKEEATKSGESTTKVEEPTKSGDSTTKVEETTKSGDNTSKVGEHDTANSTILWASASSWAIDELNKANELGVIPTIFNKEDLTKNITRKEFAHVAVRLYEKVSGQKAVAVANNPFTDTKDEEILKAYNVGITNGTSETTFEPDALITREQMATMMTRALAKAGKDTSVDMSKVTKFVDDDKMHDWGRSAIYYMSSIEIIKGVGENTFDVLGNATREQALLISERSALKFSK